MLNEPLAPTGIDDMSPPWFSVRKELNTCRGGQRQNTENQVDSPEGTSYERWLESVSE